MIAKTWSGEWWKHGGGGTVWDSMAYDPELDLLYIGVGNGSPWNYKLRSGRQGRQPVPLLDRRARAGHRRVCLALPDHAGRDWDYTATQHMILADLIDRRAAAQGADAGAEERLLLRARPRDRRIDLGEPYAHDHLGERLDLKTGRRSRSRKRATAPPASRRWSLPGPLGAHNWQPMASARRPGCLHPGDRSGVRLSRDRSEDLSCGGPAASGTSASIRWWPRSRETRRSRKAIRAASKGKLVAWDPVRASRPGPSSIRCRGTAGCCRPPAAWCSRAPATASSSPMRRAAASKLWDSTRRPASSRRRSPTRSTASNTSRSWPAGAARRRCRRRNRAARPQGRHQPHAHLQARREGDAAAAARRPRAARSAGDDGAAKEVVDAQAVLLPDDIA